MRTVSKDYAWHVIKDWMTNSMGTMDVRADNIDIDCGLVLIRIWKWGTVEISKGNEHLKCYDPMFGELFRQLSEVAR